MFCLLAFWDHVGSKLEGLRIGAELSSQTNSVRMVEQANISQWLKLRRFIVCNDNKL